MHHAGAVHSTMSRPVFNKGTTRFHIRSENDGLIFRMLSMICTRVGGGATDIGQRLQLRCAVDVTFTTTWSGYFSLNLRNTGGGQESYQRTAGFQVGQQHLLLGRASWRFPP